VLKEGQEVKAKVLDFNPAEKRISLSIKETEEAPEQPARSERNRGGRDQVEAVQKENLSFTLGERFGDKLSKLK
jgi:small subunit ribosomal protein S1